MGYPIHYACAYGADPSVLQVLTRVHPDSFTALEGKKRTPLHLAMVNSHRTGMSQVIRFLLDHKESRETINARDQDGFLPLHLLALSLHAAKPYGSDKQLNVRTCLLLYFDAKPFPGADFLAAIEDLPDWAHDCTVVSQHVRNVLNERIIHPLPSAILMMDGYMLFMIIYCFAKASKNHIAIRKQSANEDVEDTSEIYVALLLLGGAYFLFRVLIQLFSLFQMGTTRRVRSLHAWCLDAQNWLDVAVVFLVFYYGGLMLGVSSLISPSAFQAGIAYAQGVVFLNIIVHLQSTYIDFAVFVGGFLHVVQRLWAFLTAVGIILVAFAQMFYFLYTETDMCPSEAQLMNETFIESEYYEKSCFFPHCTFPKSLLRVYTMMLGEIADHTIYGSGPPETKVLAQMLYVAYAFLVVILLSNVLIAIVSDSYKKMNFSVVNLTHAL